MGQTLRKSTIMMILAGSIAAMGLVHLAAYVFFRISFEKERVPSAQVLSSDSLQQPDAPILESTVSRNIDELRRYEEDILKSYGWVDRARGILRVPIEEAVNIVIENKEL